MKLATSLVLSLMAWDSFSQTPPPNDDFVNRIVLTGDDVTFNGSADVPTTEPGEPPYPSDLEGPSTWWSWKATHDCEVTIVMLETENLSSLLWNGVGIWVGANLFQLQAVTYNFWCDYARFQLATHQTYRRFLNFQAEAGKEYQIATYGSYEHFKMRLVTTPGPFVVKSPETQTFVTGQSVCLGTMASGKLPLHYQWRFNDIDLAGETAPTLLLTNLATNQQGEYSIIVSNLNGTCTGSCQLFVTTTNVRPLLILEGIETNQFRFTIQGEIGSRYILETSDTMNSWNWISTWEWSRFIITTNGFASFSTVVNSPAAFFRAYRYAPRNEICTASLQQINYAKALWANETKHGVYDAGVELDFNDLAGYMKSHTPCPEGGTHFIGSLSATPTCSRQWYGHGMELP
jgi:hypothetical protein